MRVPYLQGGVTTINYSVTREDPVYYVTEWDGDGDDADIVRQTNGDEWLEERA